MERIPPIKEHRLTDHALFQMKRREVKESEIAQVLSAPGQAEIVRPGWVVVDVDREIPEVVTVYRTSKVEKYWRRR